VGAGAWEGPACSLVGAGSWWRGPSGAPEACELPPPPGPHPPNTIPDSSAWRMAEKIIAPVAWARGRGLAEGAHAQGNEAPVSLSTGLSTGNSPLPAGLSAGPAQPPAEAARAPGHLCLGLLEGRVPRECVDWACRGCVCLLVITDPTLLLFSSF